MALGNNGGSAPNYEPNSYESAPKENPETAEPPLHLGDVSVDRHDHREGNDDFSQAGDLYRLMKPEQKKQLVKNIASSLGQVPKDIQMRQLCQFFRADKDYGSQVAAELGIEIDPSMMSSDSTKAVLQP